MGGGSSQQPAAKLPPPPKPAIEYDPTSDAAERALMTAAKQSYATSVQDEDEEKQKAQLGVAQTNTAEQHTAQQRKEKRKQRRSAASLNPGAAGMGTSAVLTG